MGILVIVLSVLLGVAALGAGMAKIQGVEQVVESVRHVNSPLEPNVLGFILLAGGAGVLAGLAFPVLGIAAALGLTAYFAGAVVLHNRVGDGPDAYGVPAGLAALALVTAIVRIATA